MPDNVIVVPPRRRRVHYKGMFGWVEYHPSTKSWTFTFKYQVTGTYGGMSPSEAEAVLELKRAIDIVSSGGTTIRSVD